MDIHEIIHAWETHAFPKDLAALAAMQNKVDDYAYQAETWAGKSGDENIRSMYLNQWNILIMVSADIQGAIDSCIPDVPTQKLLET